MKGCEYSFSSNISDYKQSTMAPAKTVKKKKDGSGQMKYRKQRKYLDKMKKKEKDRLRWLTRKEKQKRLTKSERLEKKKLEKV
jgi:hypothetical protein